MILAAAFARLEPRDRAVVTMRLVLGVSENETAECLGCPVGTVSRDWPGHATNFIVTLNKPKSWVR